MSADPIQIYRDLLALDTTDVSRHLRWAAKWADSEQCRDIAIAMATGDDAELGRIMRRLLDDAREDEA